MRFLRVDMSTEPPLIEAMEVTNNYTVSSQPRGFGKKFNGPLPDWAKAHMTILNIAADFETMEIENIGVKYPKVNVYRLIPPEGVKL